MAAGSVPNFRCETEPWRGGGGRCRLSAASQLVAALPREGALALWGLELWGGRGRGAILGQGGSPATGLAHH